MLRPILFLYGLSLAVPAFAEPADSVRVGEDLNEVSVIGFKQDRESVSPISQTSIGSRFIQANELQDLRDLSSMMANFYMPDYGSRQSSPIYIRGIGSKINAPSVGVYVDGMPSFNRSVLDIDLFGVSKIEVLRGPQGTLFGRNSTAGLINIYTHSPLDYQNTTAKITYGTYNDLQVAASTYNKLCRSLGLSIAGNYHHNDGYIRNIYLNSKANKTDNGTVRLGLAWKPTQNWLMRYTFSFDRTVQKGYPYAIYDEEAGALGQVSYDRESGYKRTVVSTGMNWQYEGRRARFSSQTSFQHSHDKMATDQDYTNQNQLYAVMPLHQNMVSQEFTLRSKGGMRYQWIAGAFGFYQKEDYTTLIDYVARKQTLGLVNGLPTSGIAAYHVSTLDIYRGLSASVGLRYDYEDAKINNETWLAPLGNTADHKQTGTFSGHSHSSQFTPKFTLNYLFAPEQIAYATVARGFKAGGFNSVIETEADRSYDPEYTWNYELGTKLAFPGGRVSVEASLFYVDWKHQQLPITFPGKGNVVRNVGHSNSKGFELTLHANPAKGLLLQANYGYTYAQMLNGNMGTQDYTGNMLPMVPRHTLSLDAGYTLWNPLRGLDRLSFHANLTGTGPIYWREDNAMKQPFYALLNLKAAMTKGRFTWELWTKNTTDTKYMAYYFVSVQKMGQQGRPFMAGTSLVYNLK